MPPQLDAALQAMVKKAYATKYPGVEIYKTGMNYTTWKAYDKTSVAGSGTDYKIYKTEIDKSRYKIGLAFVKLLNQPYCRVRDFALAQTRNGASYSAAKVDNLSFTRFFVKCLSAKKTLIGEKLE